MRIGAKGKLGGLFAVQQMIPKVLVVVVVVVVVSVDFVSFGDKEEDERRGEEWHLRLG